eukprot:885348-Prymnesium_polylepis.1
MARCAVLHHPPSLPCTMGGSWARGDEDQCAWRRIVCAPSARAVRPIAAAQRAKAVKSVR